MEMYTLNLQNLLVIFLQQGNIEVELQGSQGSETRLSTQNFNDCIHEKCIDFYGSLKDRFKSIYIQKMAERISTKKLWPNI